MKRILSAVLVAVFVLSFLPVAFVGNAADESDEIIEISSAADLKKLANDLDAHAVLTKDIEITSSSWNPIGSQSAPFTGIFDGNGHTITYDIKFLKSSDNGVEAGLFGCVTGQVKRLTVKGELSAKVNSGNIGAIAAKLTNGARIYNCTSYVDITVDAKAASGIGGIAGTVLKSSVYSANDASVIRCENFGSIEADVTDASVSDGSALSNGTTGALGGIVGLVADTANVKIDKCINGGNITVDGGKYNIGGIVGQTSTNAATSAVYITECANKGDITVYNLVGERAAGIIAYVKSGNIDYCYNTGNIIAYSDNGKKVSTSGYGTYYGIFGYANLGGSNRLSVQCCYNASPEPLEAEICVVRNPSYATLDNFYMKGRSEYETTLNSNASAGKSGTTFTDAEELTSKLTAKTSKYVASHDGYPILAWETDSVLSSEKEVSGYITTREGEDTHDIRFILHVADKYEGADLSASFTMADGCVETQIGKLGNEIKSTSKIYASDAPYVSSEGYKIYTLTFENMEYDGWKNAELLMKKEGNEIYKSSLKYSDVFAAAEPSKIPIGDLPDFPAGAVSSVYNAGPGMENDKNSVTKTDSSMVVISAVKSASFINYIQTLKDSGYSCDFENAIENNLYYGFSKDGNNYYIYYTAIAKEARIIYDKSSTGWVTDIATEASGGSTETYQYAIDYTKGTGQTSGRDVWAIDCGMCYVIKFADNSVFIIDGGHERQTSNSALEALNDFLHEITGTAEGEKVKVTGWFFSHAHGDHVFLAHKFLDRYHDQYDLEAVYMNIPSYQVMSGGYDSGTFLMKDTINKYYPDIEDYKLHTGQNFTIQGVEFEVLFTHEDAVNAVSGTQRISNFNDSSTVIRTTIHGKSVMYLGDIDSVAESVICNTLFSAKTLKSDVVQLSHHCFNNLPNLYKAIAAPLLLCPNSVENANGNNAKRQAAIDAAGASYQGILYAGTATYKLTFDSERVEHERIAPYWEGFFVTFPTALKTFTSEAVEETPLDMSAVLGMTDVSSLIYDKSGNGTAGAKADEAPQALFDGTTSTKWCVTNSATSYVMWKTKEAVAVSAYQLSAGNDTANHQGRNPKCWTLYGSLDGVSWSVIDAVYDGNMNTANYSASTYLVDSPAEYQYYTLVVHSTEDGSNTMQISEITIYSQN